MSELVVRCSECGSPVGKRDCRCKGDGKFVSSWTTGDFTVVASPPEVEALIAAEPEVRPEPVMKGDQCVLI